MNQFLRIANARLKKVYPNKMQRKAWAAKMYVRWLRRQDETFNTKGCKHIKREGESCRLNNNCTYPNCK